MQLLDSILAVIRKHGRRGAEGGFKSQTWTLIVADFNAKTRLNLCMDQMQNCLSALKAKYTDYNEIRNKSGKSIITLSLLCLLFL